MEINKEEGNTIQINKPVLRLKPPKNGTAETVLQRHLNLHRVMDVAVKVCSCLISKQCKLQDLQCFLLLPTRLHQTPTSATEAVKLTSSS